MTGTITNPFTNDEDTVTTLDIATQQIETKVLFKEEARLYQGENLK